MNGKRMLVALALLAGAPVWVSAQGITTGEVSGVVRSAGAPLSGAQLALEPVGGGLPILAETDSNGRFVIPLLQPGDYSLLAERLGYRPLMVAPIPVRPDRRVHVPVSLERAEEGVVEAADRVAFEAGALAAGSRPGRSRAFGDLELRGVPSRDGELDELVRQSSHASVDGSEVEGLPLWLGGVVVGGIPYQVPVHGGFAVEPLTGIALPYEIAGSAELVGGRSDVEWPGVAGGLLSTALRLGPAGVGGQATVVAGSGDASAVRGGVLLGGSLLSDSARAWVLAEGEQRSDAVRYWPDGESELASALAGAGVAGADVLDADGTGERRRLSLGGRFDWRVSDGRDVDLFALYATGEEDRVRGTGGQDIPATVEATELVSGATATARLGDASTGRLRVGFSQSVRSFAPRELATVPAGLDGAIVFPLAGAQIGDPGLGMDLERSDFFGHGLFHYQSGSHRLMLGLGARFTSHRRTGFGAGQYLFDGAAGLDERAGVLHGLEGAAVAEFGVTEVFGYGQDSWEVTPGLTLTTGLRYELETLPSGDLRPNTRWRELTGIDNSAVDDRTGDFGLGVGFEWDPQEQNRWRVRGALAIQQGDVAPALLAEAITHDGAITALGAVGDVTDAVTLGPRLTILSPGIQPPRTTRGSVGLSRAFGTTALHFGAVLRLTENLPVRTDLNRPVNAPFRDPYGRPIFGELVRVGGLLAAAPGGNRRFGEFDVVSAVSSEASSTYWGITGALEKRFGALRAVASYTFSQTTDDWLAPDASLLGLHPFEGDAELGGWNDGTSDFDVPHRFSAAAELTLPFAPVQLGAQWQRASGRPFTPGFGRAVDMNADGVAGNDPAYVDDAIDGVVALQDEWDCLREFGGGFVDRNACRGPARSLVDAWLGIRIPVAGLVPELRIEALGLAAAGLRPVDTALYRLDPDGEVTMDGSGVLNVPLTVNPDFGEELGTEPEPTRIRISLRMGF